MDARKYRISAGVRWFIAISAAMLAIGLWLNDALLASIVAMSLIGFPFIIAVAILFFCYWLLVRLPADPGTR